MTKTKKATFVALNVPRNGVEPLLALLRTPISIGACLPLTRNKFLQIYSALHFLKSQLLSSCLYFCCK